MSGLWYNSGVNLVANGQLDWEADDIRALLVSSAYVYNATHAFVSAITGELTHGSYARKVLDSKSVDEDGDTARYLAGALVWSALAGGTSPAKLILYKRVSTDANSPLIGCIDVVGTADGLGDFAVAFDGTNPGPALSISTAEGVEGPPGASFIALPGAPDGGDGVNGDYYINVTNGDTYGPKTAGAWGSPTGNLRGPSGADGVDGADGADGADGSNGADGAMMRSGTGAPSNGLGANGDTYIATDTGGLYTKSGGTWSLAGSLIGPQGPTGPAAIPAIVTETTTARTLQASDFGKLLRCTNGSAVAITLNTGLAVTPGDSLLIRQAGAGQVTVSGTATRNARLTSKTHSQHATICITCVATDEYDITGDVAAS